MQNWAFGPPPVSEAWSWCLIYSGKTHLVGNLAGKKNLYDNLQVQDEENSPPQG